MRKTKILAGNVDPDTHAVLTMHAQDCGRTVSKEASHWLKVGAITTVYVSTYVPGAEDMMLAAGRTREQIEAQREAMLEDLRLTLVRALPHAIDPAALLRSMLDGVGSPDVPLAARMN